MPRRNRLVRRPVAGKRARERAAARGRRGAYRPDQAAALARIEARRRQLGVSLAELAWRAAISEATLRRMRRDGRGWRRQVRALAFVLRAIERERQVEDGVLDADA